MVSNRLAFVSTLIVIAVLSAPSQSDAQARKNSWVHGDEIPWNQTISEGKGASIKMLLTRENGFADELVRAAFLLKIEPGGSYASPNADKEDTVLYVTSGQAKVVWDTQQIDAKPGDSFGLPAGTKHQITTSGIEPVQAIVFAAPVQNTNPNVKPVWARADDMQWQPNASHGPGCDLKLILSGGFSSTIRGLWTIRVNGFGINTVHSIGEHQFYYIVDAPEPLKGTRDGRTAAARIIMGNEIVQTRPGDAFYFAGPPNPVEHGIVNENKDKPLIYVGIGIRIPGQSNPARGGR